MTMDIRKLYANVIEPLLVNIAEAVIIFNGGLWLGITSSYIIFVMLAFIITRMSIKQGKHYKSKYRCFVWTVAVYLSMLVVVEAHIVIATIIAIFAALIFSDHANIYELSFWKPKGQSTYQKEKDFVKYNPINPCLRAYEETLERDDNLSYMCYKYIFKDGKSWNETANLLDTETYKLAPVVDKVAFGIRLSCKI